jgi:hypothetical protein
MKALALTFAIVVLSGCAAWRSGSDGTDVTFRVEGRDRPPPVGELPPVKVHPLPRGHIRANCTGCHYRY